MLDELVAFMAEEVAMDGVQGCNPKRFIQHFISARSPLSQSSVPSGADHSKYAAYVWKLLAETDDIEIVVSGNPATVAAVSGPPASAPHDVAERTARDPTPLVEITQGDDIHQAQGGTHRILGPEGEEGLKRENMLELGIRYGQRVSMRGSESRYLFALTGNPIRSEKLTDVVLASLEMIARSRGKGVSTVDVGKKLKISQGTCFHVIKVLSHMGLVAKIKHIQSKAYTNVLVHRRYILLNDQYNSRVEAAASEALASNFTFISADQDEDLDDAPIDRASALPKFKPFGRVELAIPRLVKRRLTQLLRCNLWHHLIENRDLLKALGYAPKPLKKERRLLQRYIGQMVRAGLLDIVLVPRREGENDGSRGFGPHRCLRLAEFRPQQLEEEQFEEGGRVAPHTGLAVVGDDENENDEEGGDDIEEEDVEDEGVEEADDGDDKRRGPQVGVSGTIQTEFLILESLRQSGANGMTYAELARRVGNFDKRSLEAIVSRYEDAAACPSHLRQYTTWVVMETKRKERFLRIYTVDGYRDKCEAEDLPIPPGLPPRTSRHEEGGWSDLALFVRYFDLTDRQQVIETFPHAKPRAAFAAWIKGAEKGKLKNVKATKLGRPRKALPKKGAVKVVTGQPTRIPAGAGSESEEVDELREDPMEVDVAAAGRAEIASGVSASGDEDDVLPTGPFGVEEARGRPRKFIKVIGLDGELTKRRKTATFAIHPELPDTVLYNRETKVFFNLPPGYSGKGPVQKPIDWDTAIGPKQLVVPSTGLPPSARLQEADPKEMNGKGKGKRKRKREVAELHTVEPAEGYGQPISANATAAVGSMPAMKRAKNGQVSKRLAEGAQAPAAIQQGIGSGPAPKSSAVAADHAMHGSARPTTSTPTPQSEFVTNEHARPMIASILKTPVDGLKADHSSSRRVSRTDNSLELKRKELLQALDELGGVCEYAQGLMKAHYEWAQRAKAKGDPRAPKEVMQFDRRTVHKALDPLILSGALRKTAVAVEALGRPTVTFISRPDIEKAIIFQCIHDWKAAIRNKTLSGELATDTPQFTRAGPELPPKVKVNHDDDGLIALETPLEELDGMPPQETRALFLRDWRLIPQSYGFRMGKYRRAETFHGIIFGVLQSMRSATVSRGVQTESLLEVSYFYEHIPVDLYCQCVSVPIWSDELASFLSNPATRRSPVGSAPAEIQRVLRTRYTGVRKKIKDLLIILSTLGLIEGRVYQTVEGETSSLPTEMEKATHIRCLSVVPLYNFGGEAAEAALVTSMSLRTLDEVRNLWYLIWQFSVTTDAVNQKALENLETSLGGFVVDPAASGFPDLKLRADIRKPDRWLAEYRLTKAQKRYLLAQLPPKPDPSLEPSIRPIQELAYRICAPELVVDAHMRKLCAAAYRREQRKANEAAKSNSKPPEISREIVRAALAEKVRLRDAVFERDWQVLVSGVLQPRSLPMSDALHLALKPVRSKWFQNKTAFNMQWLLSAVNSYFNKLAEKQSQPAPSPAAVVTQRTVPRAKPLVPLKRGQKATQPGIRTRTHWDKVSDELALDAYVILNHRLQHLGLPMNYRNAYDLLGILFPDVDSVKVKHRVTKYRNLGHKEDAFVERLISAWDVIYKKLRGTEELPEPIPDSLHDIDLLLWIDVYRKHMKKGIIERSIGEPRPEDRALMLPTNIAELTSNFQPVPVASRGSNVLPDVLWDIHIADERKELAAHAESYCTPKLSSSLKSPKQDLLRMCIKMIISSPQWSYKHEKAHRILKSVDESELQKKLAEMLREGVIVPVNAEDSTRAPGRTYAISSAYESALSKPYSPQFLDDAASVVELFGEDVFIDWPMISQAGEFAGAIALASTGQLVFEIDSAACSCLNSRRNEYATKTIEDQDFELSIGVRLKQLLTDPETELHAGVIGQTRVSTSDGLDPVAPVNRSLDIRTKAIIDAAGSEGVSFSSLVSFLQVSEGEAADSVRRLTLSLDTPMVLSSGFILGPLQAATWRVTCASEVEDGQEKLVFPRQWLDIYGNINEERWNKVYGVVLGSVLRQPGINGRALRAQLSATLDTLEIDDILNSLLREGRIVQVSSSQTARRALLGLATAREELQEHYFVKETTWEAVTSGIEVVDE